MADQIIIELIGDPSGLKPAEEALKELSRISKENMEAFRKANETFDKFVETQVEVAKKSEEATETSIKHTESLKGLNEHAGRAAKTFSQLSTSIAASGIKGATAEILQYTKELKDLETEKQKLQSIQAEETAKMNAAKAAINAAKAEQKELNDQIKANKTALEQNTKTTGENAQALVILEQKAQTVIDTMVEIQKKMDAEREQTGVNTQAYAGYSSQMEKFGNSLMTVEAAIYRNKEEAKILQSTNESLQASIGGLYHQIEEEKKKIHESTAAIRESNIALRENKEALRETKESFIENAKNAAKASLENNKFYKSLKSSAEALENFNDIGIAVSKGMKLMGVENEKVENALRKVTQAMEFARAAQQALNAASEISAVISGTMAAGATVAAGAEGGATVATWSLTGAVIALDVALSPIILIIAAVVAGIAQVVAGFLIFYKISTSLIAIIKEKTDWFQRLDGVIKVVTTTLSEWGDKLRDVLSWLSNGAIDDAKVHKFNEALKESVKQFDEENEKLKKQVDLMEAQGSSADAILEKKKEQLEKEGELLNAQLQIAKNEKDEEKQKELIAKIDENSLELIKNKKEAEDAHIQTLKQEGASNLAILTYQRQQNTEALKASDLAFAHIKTEIQKNEALIAQLQTQIEINKANGILTTNTLAQIVSLRHHTDELKKQSEEIEHQNKVLHAQKTEIQDGINEELKKIDDKRKEATTKALQDKKAVADSELAITTAGSKEELTAKINDINAAAAVEKNAAENNIKDKDEKALIKKNIDLKALQDVEAAKRAFAMKEIQDEKTDLENQLADTRKGSQEEYDIKMQILGKQRELIAANTALSANDQLKAFNDVNKKEDELWADHLRHIEAAELNALKDTDQLKLLNENASSAEYLRLKKELIQIALKEEEAAINASNKSEAEKKAAIDLARANAAMKTNKLITDNAAALINEELQAELDKNNKLIEADEKKKGKAKEIQQLKIANINAEIKANKEMLDKKLIDDKAYADKKKKLDKELADAQKKQNKELTADQKKAAAAAIEAAKQVSEAIFANKEQARQNELKATIDTLNAQKNAELLNTTLTASQRAAIEKKYKAEEAAAKLKAWKAEQKAKEEQAIINGLLAFTSSLAQQGYPAGLVTGLLALAMAGVQAGIIASKTPPKFATGTPGAMVTPAGMKWVGEQGPELIYTPGGEKIMTNADSMAFLEKYRIPAMPSVDHLLEGTGVRLASSSNKDMVEAISSLRKDLKNLKQVNVSIDEKGYRLSISKNNSRTEYLNRKAEL
jgi:hypothetical protein